MKRPLVSLTVIFCLGISVANLTKIPFLLAYFLTTALLVLTSLSVKKGLRFNSLLFFLVLCLGITLFLEHEVLPGNHISFLLPYYDKNKEYLVKGVIDSQPQLKDNKTSFLFKLEEIQSEDSRYKICGNILAQVKGRKNLVYGEEIILIGNLHRPYSFGAANRKSYRHYLYSQGIRYIMNVKTLSRVTRLNKNKGFSIKRLALWLKVRIEEIISRRLSYLAAGILDAMVLGEKKNIPAFVYKSMIKSGTVHILVVSGFNVGLVAFIIVLFLKIIRIPRVMRFYIASPLLIIYCLMTGASTPVVRATLMAVVFMFAYLVKREPDIYNSFATAAIFILAANPNQLFDIGFQLSFASVISIVYLYPKIKLFLCPKIINSSLARYLIDGCLVSFSAWVGTAGFIAYYFKIISSVTVLANIFVVPLASLITLCGFSLIMMELIFPPVARLFAYACEFIAMLLVIINNLLIKLPGAYLNLNR